MIYYILFLHWLADFRLQNRYIAVNKSKSNKVLSLHVAIYGVVLFLGCSIFLAEVRGTNLLAFVGINAILHWITDFVTSRLNAYYWHTKQEGNFWSCIGIDQYIHTVTLILTANWLLAF